MIIRKKIRVVLTADLTSRFNLHQQNINPKYITIRSTVGIEGTIMEPLNTSQKPNLAWVT